MSSSVTKATRHTCIIRHLLMSPLFSGFVLRAVYVLVRMSYLCQLYVCIPIQTAICLCAGGVSGAAPPVTSLMPPALTRRTLLLQLADTDGKDWRADLLTAVHNVFAKDRDSTQAELRTYKIVHRDQAGLLEAMEDKVRQQVRAALSRCISRAHCSLRLCDVLYLT